MSNLTFIRRVALFAFVLLCARSAAYPSPIVTSGLSYTFNFSALGITDAGSVEPASGLVPLRYRVLDHTLMLGKKIYGGLIQYLPKTASEVGLQRKPAPELLNRMRNNGTKPRYAPNQILVKFRQGAGALVEEALSGVCRGTGHHESATLKALLNKYKVKGIKPLFPMPLSAKQGTVQAAKREMRRQKIVAKLEGLYLLTLSDITQPIEEVCRRFEEDPLVEYASPNFTRGIDLIPNDPRFGELWGMHNVGQGGGTVDADVDAPEAWDVETGNQKVVVGVIDTGVDYSHEDLAANIWTNEGETGIDENGNNKQTNGIDDDGNGYVDDVHGYDFINDDGDPMDDHSHGTHVAGTIGAVGNNNIGVSGVCWDVKIMAVKFLDANGHGYDSDAILAINYATLMGAYLTNNSWGGDSYSQALKDVIEAAGDAGTLFIAAAGNSSVDNDILPSYPSFYACDNIIAVAAMDHNDKLANFSNWGLHSVDVGAPGENILSTLPGNKYGTYSGTSMASPHVSGVAALIWSSNLAVPHLAVKQFILDTVDHLSALEGKVVTGGRINSFSAVSKLLSHKGDVRLDNQEYTCSDTVTIMVNDTDLNKNPDIAETATVELGSEPTNDLETVTLTEVDKDVGIFTGAIALVGTVESGDGQLGVAHDDTITVTYHDADDGTGNPADIQDTARVDCQAPEFAGLTTALRGVGAAHLSWNEATDSGGPIMYNVYRDQEPGLPIGELINSTSNLYCADYNVEPEQYYSYVVRAQDAAGNEEGNIVEHGVTIPYEVTVSPNPTGLWDHPFCTYAHDARTQSIYYAGEIGGAGKIVALALNVRWGPNGPLDAWTIRMKHTQLGATAGLEGPDSGWTTVYQAQEKIWGEGWYSFALGVPFEYKGSDNLMVDFSFNNSSAVGGLLGCGMCHYSEVGQHRTAAFYSDSEHGDPLTWSGDIPFSSYNLICDLKLGVDSWTALPTPTHSATPTETPTMSPTLIPSGTPTMSPTSTPTTTPSATGAPTETPTQTPSAQMFPTSTPSATPPTPTATPIPPLVIDPGPLTAGQPFTLGIALIEDSTRPFDFYLLAETPAGVYTIYMNGKIKKGITPLYKNVKSFLKDFITTVRPKVKIPASMKGKTITFYSVVVQAGKKPPVRKLSDLTPSTRYVILFAKASAVVN